MRGIVTILITLLLLAASADTDARRRRTSGDVRREHTQNRRAIKQTSEQIEANAAEVGRQLNNLQKLEAVIALRADSIRQYRDRINTVNARIDSLTDSIATLEATYSRLKDSYATTLRNMRTRRQSMSDLAFIFSAGTFSQAWSRLRYLREIARTTTRRATQIKQLGQTLAEANNRLTLMRDSLSLSMQALQAAQTAQTAERASASSIVTSLRKQGRALTRELERRRALAAALESELQQAIAREEAEEAERRRQAEEAERQRQAQEAERRRQAEEAERQRQAQEAERQRQQQQQQQRQQQQQQQTPASKQPAIPAPQPKQPAAPTPKQPATTQPATPAPPSEAAMAKLTGSFGANKGKLPFPVTGRYTIVSNFGTNSHPELAKVQYDNLGIDIEATPGASARAVFDGYVSSIFRLDGYNNVVIVRHGEYLTVYAGLDNLTVRKGDKVSTGQKIGTIYSDPADDSRTILHFEIRQEKKKLNPVEWVR